MNLRIVTEYDTETDSYSAYCPELPGCTSAGETEEEALENMKEAVDLWFQPDKIPVSSQHIHEITV